MTRRSLSIKMMLLGEIVKHSYCFPTASIIQDQKDLCSSRAEFFLATAKLGISVGSDSLNAQNLL